MPEDVGNRLCGCHWCTVRSVNHLTMHLHLNRPDHFASSDKLKLKSIVPTITVQYAPLLKLPELRQAGAYYAELVHFRHLRMFRTN